MHKLKSNLHSCRQTRNSLDINCMFNARLSKYRDYSLPPSLTSSQFDSFFLFLDVIVGTESASKHITSDSTMREWCATNKAQEGGKKWMNKSSKVEEKIKSFQVRDSRIANAQFPKCFFVFFFILCFSSRMEPQDTKSGFFVWNNIYNWPKISFVRFSHFSELHFFSNSLTQNWSLRREREKEKMKILKR